MQKHFKKLENMYHAAPFQELIKSKLKISEGEAELEMEIDPYCIMPQMPFMALCILR